MNHQLTNAVTEQIKSVQSPEFVYQKPQTSLFLENALSIQSGAEFVLESQGGGGDGWLES